jgi:hypothetical protein
MQYTFVSPKQTRTIADLNPLLFRADQCTKISAFVSSSGVKNPKPFLESNHFTVPVILEPSLENKRRLEMVNRGRVKAAIRDNIVELFPLINGLTVSVSEEDRRTKGLAVGLP